MKKIILITLTPSLLQCILFCNKEKLIIIEIELINWELYFFFFVLDYLDYLVLIYIIIIH